MTMSPFWYETPVSVYVNVSENRVTKSPLGNEVSINLEVGPDTCNIIVPTEALDETLWRVPATKVGEKNGRVMLSFPSTSLGTSSCSVEKDQIDSLINGS